MKVEFALGTTFGEKFCSYVGMAETLPPRKRGNSLAVWTIGFVLAGLIFCGTWIAVKFQQQVSQRPPVITHSTPVGGQVEDGVYRSTPHDDVDPEVSRWRI